MIYNYLLCDMNKLHRIIIPLILFQIAFGQGKAGSTFLSINPGARANSMGEAQIGVANDVYASYYNPAGLSNLAKKEFSFMHTGYMPNLADDMSFDYLGFALPNFYGGSLGGYLSYLNLGDQISTDDVGNELGSFSSYMYALNLSFSKNISEFSAFGISGKYFFQELAVFGDLDASSGNFAFDVGYFRRNFLENDNLNFGTVISNLGSGVSFNEGKKDPLPTRLGIGLSYLAMDDKLNLAFDIRREINDSITSTSFGLEYLLMNNFAIRGGYLNDLSGNLNYLTLGLGANLSSIGFDLSYILGDDLDPHSDTLRFSIISSF